MCFRRQRDQTRASPRLAIVFRNRRSSAGVEANSRRDVPDQEQRNPTPPRP
jgi:hypothetical protein